MASKTTDLDNSLKTRFANNKHRMLANIVFTGNWLRNNMNQFTAPYGLSHQQFNILRILRGKGDWMSMNDIKNVMIDKSPHTTRMVTKLMDKGWVDRKRSSDDRRVVFVSITKSGLDVLSEIDEVTDEATSFLNNISEEEADTINQILDKMRE